MKDWELKLLACLFLLSLQQLQWTFVLPFPNHCSEQPLQGGNRQCQIGYAVVVVYWPECCENVN